MLNLARDSVSKQNRLQVKYLALAATILTSASQKLALLRDAMRLKLT